MGKARFNFETMSEEDMRNSRRYSCGFEMPTAYLTDDEIKEINDPRPVPGTINLFDGLDNENTGYKH